jgi:hypothetical protein
LHYPKRAGHHAGFTADTLFLAHLYATVNLAYRAVRTAAGAGRAFTMVTRYGVTFLLAFDEHNPRQKTPFGQDVLLIVMRHDAGHFAGPASDTFVTIAQNKVVHGILPSSR